MSSSAQTQASSPAVIFDALQGYHRTMALRGAIELDLFTTIADGNQSVSAIAASIRASEKGTRVLCDFLTIMGLLVKQGGEYALTADSAAFLNRHSPAYMGTIASFVASPRMTHTLDDIAGLVRKGGTLGDELVGDVNDLWVEFARSMASVMALPAELIAKMFASDSRSMKVLDISASHGLYGIAFARNNPSAKVVGLDSGNVLEVAKENAREAGVSDRYFTIAGSAFEVDLGSAYDIVLIPNFLHHFDAGTNEKLLRRVHDALAPDGITIAPDFIPNEDRVSPARDASFSMQMLAATQHGDAYTYSELEAMFRNAGFSRSELRELTPYPQRMVVSYK
jgi:2-polyprenyl-3-methyl-5-hydroxy-6-metoxy-1,4-benzoquinol methylase